jgi:hypothetical protein
MFRLARRRLLLSAFADHGSVRPCWGARLVVVWCERLRLVAVLRCSLRGLFGRSFLDATVPQPVPSWTPADCLTCPRSDASAPDTDKICSIVLRAPRRSTIRNTPGPRTRSRGHLELAWSRRDSRALQRRINTVTWSKAFLAPCGFRWYTSATWAEDRATVGTDPSAAPGLEEE